MFIFALILGLVIGVIIGRVYGWMKYSYPENQEIVRVKTAKLRAERARYEADEEATRREIDRSLNERIG